jgi:hypothetical protein
VTWFDEEERVLVQRAELFDEKGEDRGVRNLGGKGRGNEINRKVCVPLFAPVSTP